MMELTGNVVFDFYFGLVSLFAFTGWSFGVIKGLVKRLIR